MRGDLVEKTAADVCRELATQGASGILAIDGPGGPGRVVFADGRIIAAVSPTPRARLGDRLVGAGELDPDDLANALDAQQEEGESLPLGSLLVERGLVRRDAVRVFVQEQVLDALFEIIRWRYGAFTFTPDDEARGHGVPLSLSVDDALVEVARRQHEWDELSQIIPDLDSVPSFRTGAATANAALEPDEFAVLASVDGVRSVRALAADLGYGEFEAARIVYGLSLLGIVDVRPPQDEIGAALEDALGLGDFEPSTAAGALETTTEDDTMSDDPAAEDVAADADVGTEPPDRTEEPAATAEAVAFDEPAADETVAADEPDDTAASDEAPPSEPERHDEPTPVPPPSHLHVVADPPEPPADEPEPQPTGSGDEPDVWVSADEPGQPAQPAPPSEPSPDQRRPVPIDVPDQPAATTGPTSDDHPADASEPAAPAATGGAPLDAEVDLPADAVADPGTPDPAATEPAGEPVAEEDTDPAVREEPVGDAEIGRWDELFSAAEQAATDPSEDIEDRETAAAAERPDEGSSAAPTTGPEPWSSSPPDRVEERAPQTPPSSSPPPPQPKEPEQPAASAPDEPSAPAPSTGQRGDDNDVSEFLRELSRLSVDGPSDAAAPKPPVRPSSSSPSSDDSKKKRRGLFGRG